MSSESHKKPGVAFWASVVLSLPILYVLGVGPACWISSRTNVGASTVSAVYRPLTWGMSHNALIAGAVGWYSEVGSAKDWIWRSANGSTWAHWDSDGLDKWIYSPKYRAINRNFGVD